MYLRVHQCGGASVTNPDEGVSIEQAIVLFGELPSPNMHRGRQLMLRIQPPGWGNDQPWIVEFFEQQLAGLDKIVGKLRAGELRAAGLLRSSPASAGRVEIHADRWWILEIPDPRQSSAVGLEIALDGILIFCSASERGTHEDHRAGQTLKAAAAAYIARHAPELRPLGKNEQARRVAVAIGCKLSTAKNAISIEQAAGGKLAGQS